MLSLSRTVIAPQPTNVHRLPMTPGIPDFHYYVQEAINQKGTPVEISWKTPSKATRFQLRIWQEYNLNWQLSCTAQGETNVIWRHEGSDVLLMYNLVITACGERGETESEEEQFDQSSTFRDIEKINRRPSPFHYGDSSEGVVAAKKTSWLRTTVSLTGDLSQSSAAIVLHSFATALITGRLTVRGGIASGTMIYFNRGEIVHAQQSYHSGFDVISQLLCADKGTYEFESGITTMELTIFCDVNTLITQANKLREWLNELEKSGWTEKSVIIRHIYKTVPCERIDQCLRQADSNLELHRKFYRSIDEQSTAPEIARRLGMSRSQWIPVLAHLLASNLIAFASAPIPQLFICQESATKPVKEAQTAEQQRGMVDSLCRLMKSTVTGIFTYPALLFFMEQEIQRCKRTHAPMSLIVFDLSAVRSDGQKMPLPLEAVKEMIMRVNSSKRGSDTLTHFQDASEYALLLPDTDIEGARKFAHKLLSAMMEAPLMPGVDCRNLEISYGFASVPDHGSSVETLTVAATTTTIQDHALPLRHALSA